MKRFSAPTLLLLAALTACTASPLGVGGLVLSPKDQALTLRLRLRGQDGAYKLAAMPDGFNRATVTLSSASALAEPIVRQTTASSFSYPYTTLTLSFPPLRPASDYRVQVDLETTGSGEAFLEASGASVAQTLSTGANTVDVLLSVPTVSTLAGGKDNGDGTVDGTAVGYRDAAQMQQPEGLVVDGAGNFFTVEQTGQRILKITPDGTVSVLTNNGGLNGYVNGASGTARFFAPHGLAIDPAGLLYVGDWKNHAIRRVTTAGVVSTVVGALPPAVPDYLNGNGTAARANGPVGVVCDGTYVYWSDYYSATIRKFTVASPYTTSLVAGVPDAPGYVNGAAASAKFNSPIGLVHDGKGALYVADGVNHAIRKIDLTTNQVSTVAGSDAPTVAAGTTDGVGTASRVTQPRHLAVHPRTGDVYFTEGGKGALRRISKATGYVQTLLGGNDRAAAAYADGVATRAEVAYLGGLVFSPDGETLTFSDRYNHRLRQYTLESRAVTTLAGTAGITGTTNGTRLDASFHDPCGLVREPAGSLVIADYLNHALRRYNPTTGEVSTLAGTPGTPGNGAALMNGPTGVARDAAGNFYAAEWLSHTIRKITSAGAVSILAGGYGTGTFADGSRSAARFKNPHDVAVKADGSAVYVADRYNNRIRRILTSGLATDAGKVTTIAGTGVAGAAPGALGTSTCNGPAGLHLDEATNTLYFVDTVTGMVRKLDLATNVVTNIAGTGTSGFADGATGATSQFGGLVAIALGPDGYLYVTDGSHRIRRVDPVTGETTTYAGSGTPGDGGYTGGKASTTRFNLPYGLAFDPGGALYVVDRYNQVLRKVQ